MDSRLSGKEQKSKKELKQEKMLLARKDKRNRRMRILFIKVTEQLLKEEGIKNITIRKIANEAGYSSATIYSYFDDLDELILYASMKYRKDYIKSLSREIKSEMTALEQYRKIYQLFNYYTFRNPEIFMNMFFGKHSYRLKDIADTYYDLFPEKSIQFPLVHNLLMFLGGRVYDTDLYLCGRLAKEGYIKQKNVEIIASILVRLHKSYLYDLCVNPQYDLNKYSEEFLKIFDHVIGTG